MTSGRGQGALGVIRAVSIEAPSIELLGKRQFVKRTQINLGISLAREKLRFSSGWNYHDANQRGHATAASVGIYKCSLSYV